LSESTITYKDVSSTQVNVSLTQPEGYFDYLDFSLKLLSTNSLNYFVNKTPPSECTIGNTKERLNLTLDDIQNYFEIDGLCPLSFFNGTVRTIRDGFESVESVNLYRNSKF
jgi:hypothetical protein